MEKQAMTAFSIDMAWEVALHEPPEIAQTSGLLTIQACNETLTRNIDNWSRTVRNEARLSAYPLALWLAHSWWRLRHEVLPVSQPSHDWRMSHELCATGYGYTWPQILLASEGEFVNIWSIPGKEIPESSIQYLAGGTQTVTANEFEQSIDRFITATIARLDSVSIHSTPLHELWAEVHTERRDPELAEYRRYEAMLGYDPGDAPEDLINQFPTMEPDIGKAALAEITPICASAAPQEQLSEIHKLARSSGLNAKISDLSSVKAHILDEPKKRPPWQTGQLMARKAREYFGLNGGAISDQRLCDIFCLSSNAIHEEPSSPRPILGLAIRSEDPDTLAIHLRKRSMTARRFELARVIADQIVAAPSDRWLPLTDAKTSRQKMQRAFAAEFLAPVQGIMNFLQDDLSSDAIDEAAEHFKVAPLAVQSQLMNSGHLYPKMLDTGYQAYTFPYLINDGIHDATII